MRSTVLPGFEASFRSATATWWVSVFGVTVQPRPLLSAVFLTAEAAPRSAKAMAYPPVEVFTRSPEELGYAPPQ
ncbi:hypothetical protein ACWD4O_09885 [Streptomyces sp. NPDC002623]